MTKQEIERAIENNESVWIIGYGYNNVFEIKLTNKCFIKDNFVHFENKERYSRFLFYKTKAEAEHYLNHANITRTEQLPFLTWEDITTLMLDRNKFGLNHNDRVLARIITKDSIYYFKLCKDFDLFTFQLKQTYIGEDLCEEIRGRFPKLLGRATEENFYKAYDECVRLFKGE